jgi:hypothetical protein
MKGREMLNDNTGSGAPTITLRRWKVVMVGLRSGTRSRHAWGHDAASDEGRVSDAIVDFKQETMTVTTSSGAHYRLAGLPGHSKKAQPVWEEWCQEHGVLVERDVTNDYMDPDDVSTRQFVALNVSAFSTNAE